MAASARKAMTARLIDSLHVEAMLLADEARAYFDRRNRAPEPGLDAEQRVLLACESLRITTRLMHVIAWLLNRRAETAGEQIDAAAPERRLGEARDSDPITVATLPEAARALIAASSDLHARVARLDQGLDEPAADSPARRLQGRLEGARF